MVGGVGLDLGWYYLKVSRMQNAADAAVLAGAWKFLDDEGTLSDYSSAKLIDFVPSYILKDPDTGDTEAKVYVKKNLAPDANWDGDKLDDGYGSHNESDKAQNTNVISFDSQLYGSGKDLEDYGYYTMWYQVVLEEEVKHLFMPGWFEPMTARVQSVAKIVHYVTGEDLFTQTEAIAEAQTYKSWDHIKAAKSNNNTNADNRSVITTGNKLRDGDKNRFELLRLGGYGGQGAAKTDPYSKTGSRDQRGYDDLFLDWQGEGAPSDKTKDYDLGVNNWASNNTWARKFEAGKEGAALSGDDLKRRIHGTINFETDANGNFPYHVRDADFYRANPSALKEVRDINGDLYKGMSDEELIAKIAKEPTDPLYMRIESEPYRDGEGLDANGNHKGPNGSSVRQIIINLNVANMTKYTSGKYEGSYSDRPVFFYYTGPENVSDFDKTKTADHTRDSLPVIINFNQDFRGIFFFPNSPVVINGNENNFEGYIIAKEYVMLKKYKYEQYEHDITGSWGDFLWDEANNVYYDKYYLIKSLDNKIKNSPRYQSVTVNGETKYIRKTDLENLTSYKDADSNYTKLGNSWYTSDTVGTAEEMAYASGNGKVKYYWTFRKKKNQDWIYKGEGWFNRKDGKVFQTFQSTWNYNNNGNDTVANYDSLSDANKIKTYYSQGAFRAQEILADGSEGVWLDETDDYKNKFLLKPNLVNNQNDSINRPTPMDHFFDTAEELLNAIGGYTKTGDVWVKDTATTYTKIETGGDTYYIPSTVAFTLYDGEDPVDSVAIKYYNDSGNEVEGFADLSENPTPYYVTYQYDNAGNATTDNPMWVDEMGNVQYILQRDDDGKEVEYTFGKDAVPYFTIEPDESGSWLYTDTALAENVEAEVVKMLSSKYNKNEDAAYFKTNYADEYNTEFTRLFAEKYPHMLESGAAEYYNKNLFNLNSSVFDNFQLVKMTEYSYLNKQGDSRSTQNIFTSEYSYGVV